MEFRELSDEQWKFIKLHLPPQPIVRWGDMPECYGSNVTA